MTLNLMRRINLPDESNFPLMTLEAQTDFIRQLQYDRDHAYKQSLLKPTRKKAKKKAGTRKRTAKPKISQEDQLLKLLSGMSEKDLAELKNIYT